MDPAKATRSLAAVLVADVVGYSRLMERDEGGTHERMRDLDASVLAPTFARHDGRVVKTTGDGYVVEFGSATSALRCALAIQDAMSERDAGLADADRIRFRIGVNVGDILHFENDVAGSGVNLAARLQALAEPGGICIAQPVREQVVEDLGVHYVDGGVQRIKNMRPVHVYHVSRSPPSRLQTLRMRLGRRDALGMAAIGTAMAVAVVATYVTISPTSSPSPDGPEALSVAVLPYTTRSDDLAARAIAGSLGESLYRALIPERQLLKVKRGERTPDANETSSVAQLNRRDGARYAVTGDVARDAAGLSVDTRLIDTRSGTVLWADRVRVPARFATPEATALPQRLTNAVHQEVFTAEIERERARPAEHPGAVEHVLRGYGRWLAGDLEGARTHFDAALRVDPRHVPALLALANVVENEADRRGEANAAEVLARVDELTRAAVHADPSCADSWTTRSNVLVRMKQKASGLAALDRALALNPFNAWAEAERDALLVGEGRSREILRPLEEIRFLYERSWILQNHLSVQCRARVLSSSLDEAVDVCEQGYVAGDSASLLHLAALYGLRGEPAKAGELLSKLPAKSPSSTLASVRAARWQPFVATPAYEAQAESTLYRGLRLAGMAER